MPKDASLNSRTAFARSGLFPRTRIASAAESSSSPAAASASSCLRCSSSPMGGLPGCGPPSSGATASSALAAGAQCATLRSAASMSAAWAPGRVSSAQASRNGCSGSQARPPRIRASTPPRSSRQFDEKIRTCSSSANGASCSRWSIKVWASFSMHLCMTAWKFGALRRRASTSMGGARHLENTHDSVWSVRSTPPTAAMRESPSSLSMPSRSAMASSTAATMYWLKGKVSKKLHTSVSVSMSREASRASPDRLLTAFQRSCNPATTWRRP
mmetsp:Transcript_41435/g.117261  ORF Transcript_41435/g.117261 Transcript_41435/m.117261 type:complete len:271 (-) Transcript_41435:34-846(-)